MSAATIPEIRRLLEYVTEKLDPASGISEAERAHFLGVLVGIAHHLLEELEQKG